MKRCLPPPSVRQRGAVLVIAMVVLMVIAVLSLSSLRASDSGQQVNANLQSRQEGLDAAQVAIERVVSSREFFMNPTAITAAPYSPVSVDIHGDGKPDYAVTMQRPECLRARPVAPSELDPGSPRDRACLSSSSAQESGLVGSPGQSGSICSDTEWQLSAAAASSANGTRVTVRQGVAVRVRTTDADSFCAL